MHFKKLNCLLTGSDNYQMKYAYIITVIYNINGFLHFELKCPILRTFAAKKTDRQIFEKIHIS